jgi:hypothetical protein
MALSPVAAAAFSPAIFASAPAGESRGDLAGLDDGEQAILLLRFNGDLTRPRLAGAGHLADAGLSAAQPRVRLSPGLPARPEPPGFPAGLGG